MSEAPVLTLSQINGRFKLLDGPVAIPGHCVVCGGVKGQFIDIGMDVEFYGAIIFCVPCIKAAAEIIDLVSGEKVRELEDKLDTQSVALKRTTEAFNEYVAHLDNMHVRFMHSLHGLFNVPEQASSEVSTEPESGTVETPEQSIDALIDEGPVSVPSSSSDGESESIFDF